VIWIYPERLEEMYLLLLCDRLKAIGYLTRALIPFLRATQNQICVGSVDFPWFCRYCQTLKNVPVLDGNLCAILPSKIWRIIFAYCPLVTHRNQQCICQDDTCVHVFRHCLEAGKSILTKISCIPDGTWQYYLKTLLLYDNRVWESSQSSFVHIMKNFRKLSDPTCHPPGKSQFCQDVACPARIINFYQSQVVEQPKGVIDLDLSFL
jgi:hypothetical protein